MAIDLNRSKRRLRNYAVYLARETERQNRRRNLRRETINAIKVTSGCAECGETHPACLQFHHKDGTEKVNTVNRLVAQNKSTEIIMAEVAKCDVLCANCHAKHHWSERYDTI